METCREGRPFLIEGLVLLPDHLHVMMTLPEGDVAYSERLAMIKCISRGSTCEMVEERRDGRRRG